MSASANADNDAPVPCANDCGFWGRPSTSNYCSTCYKQKVGKVEQEKKESLKASATASVELEGQSKETEKVEEVKVTAAKVKDDVGFEKSKVAVPEKSKTIEEVQVKVPERAVQKNKRRCFSCRKKVGLTGTECRCGYVYCGEHRYPEEHNCDFDFHKLAKQKVATKTGGAVVDKVQGEKL